MALDLGSAPGGRRKVAVVQDDTYSVVLVGDGQPERREQSVERMNEPEEPLQEIGADSIALEPEIAQDTA